MSISDAESIPKGRILVFYPFVRSFGGIERLLVDLHLECATRGRTVELVCFESRVDFSGYSEVPLPVHQLRGRRNFICEIARLRRFLNSYAQSDDAILAMEMYGALFASGIRQNYSLHIADTPALLPRDLTRFSWTAASRTAISTDQPGLRTRLKGEFVFRLIRRGVRRARRCATMTRRNATDLLTTFGEEFAVIPPGVAEWTSRTMAAPEECVVLSVCRLEASKRVDWIIRAFSELPEPLRSSCRLWIVGDGSERPALQSSAAALGISDRITFWGHVSESQLEECYNRSSIFVMPAKQGYGLPGLEALARGLRLILHQESGVSETLEDCKRAMIITDEPGLKSAVESFCRTHSTACKLSLQVRTRRDWCCDLLQCFGWR
jgi:glycosyltransferase involved in cell wall biosynthesis